MVGAMGVMARGASVDAGMGLGRPGLERVTIDAKTWFFFLKSQDTYQTVRFMTGRAVPVT